MSSFNPFAAPRRASIFLQDNPLESLEFDAIFDEQHHSSVNITDHPVEEGVDVTDHARRNPADFSCRIVVSNHPIIVLRSARAQPSIRGGNPDSRAEDAYGFLVELADNRSLVGFITTLREYANMLIEDVTCNRGPATGNMVDITMRLREITIANTETVAAPDPVNPSRKKKTNVGKKVKTAAKPATAARTQSVLFSIFNLFGG